MYRRGWLVDGPQCAVADGGEVVAGGKMLTNLGKNFVEPTIIKMPAQTEIVKTETFAPILYLLEYETIEDALRIHNDVPQGLSSAVGGRRLQLITRRSQVRVLPPLPLKKTPKGVFLI